MKKTFMIIFLCMLVLSAAAYAADETVETVAVTATNAKQVQTEIITGAGLKANTETKNAGEASNITVMQQTRTEDGNGTMVRHLKITTVKAGLFDAKGYQTQLQTENGVRSVEAHSSLEVVAEQVQNRTQLKTQLSNGRNAEIKVMPDTASQTAIKRLRLNYCNADNNCSIELKEVGQGKQVNAAYEVRAQKEVKILGMFRARMQVQAQVDAESGEVIQAKKPWWAFLATE